MTKLLPMLSEQALWWVQEEKTPEFAMMRLGLVTWLESVAENPVPGHEKVAIKAMIDMAKRCASAYPDDRQEWAMAFYKAADELIAGGSRDDD